MNIETKNNEVKLTLPTTVGVANIDSLFEVLNQVRASSGDVELDCSNVSFVDPLGMTVLAAAIREALDEGRRVAMPWLAKNTTSYRERMNFFVGLDIDGVDLPLNRTRHDQSANLLEMTRIADAGKSEAVADQLSTAIVSKIIGRGPKPVNFHVPDTEYRVGAAPSPRLPPNSHRPGGGPPTGQRRPA
ncbi:STAS domain-containing protein [Rhodoferax sp.]|uniref:STAS domain-containing protein n=1 Tax=Rhodoferax sp. TaxID=50421 RepID=UPI003BB63B2D